jgi:hypothetical protein
MVNSTLSESRCLRKTITQPGDWWIEFESAAKKSGISLAEWIGMACVERLPKSTARRLSERPPAHRPSYKN